MAVRAQGRAWESGVLMPVQIRQKDPLPQQVADLITSTPVEQMPIWPALDGLSTHTAVESVEVDPDGIVVANNGRFSGVFNVYVTLQYGKDEAEGFLTSDSFLAEFTGHFEGGDPQIDTMAVDTSSFYE